MKNIIRTLSKTSSPNEKPHQSFEFRLPEEYIKKDGIYNENANYFADEGNEYARAFGK
jgi:hypothetical protein